jgi:hypothetical protein
LAVHNYASENGCLPPAYLADSEGRPMHSWRVLLLPYMEQTQLFNAYNLSEPWNGPNNAKLAGQIGNAFRRPEATGDSVMTSFVAVVGPQTPFPGARSLKFDDIVDGTSSTIMFVEIANSNICWMEPRDLSFDRMSFRVNDRNIACVGSPYGGARIALMNGSVREIKNTLPPEVLRALVTASGHETVDLDNYP